MEHYNLKTCKTLLYRGLYNGVRENSEKHLRLKHRVEERIMGQTYTPKVTIIVDW